jgi:hypothetical protein
VTDLTTVTSQTIITKTGGSTEETETPSCADVEIRNPGFESGLLDPWTNHLGESSYLTVYANSTSTPCHSGEYCLGFNRWGTDPSGAPVSTLIQNVSTCPGVTYNFSAYARLGQLGSTDCFSKISSSDGETETIGEAVLYDGTSLDWVKTSLSIAVKSTSLELRLYAYCGQIVGDVIVYADDFTLEATHVPSNSTVVIDGRTSH